MSGTRGIAAIADAAHAAVITLGDMPRVTPQVIARFADLAAEHGALARARAVYDGVPGHPVVLGRAMDGSDRLTQQKWPPTAGDHREGIEASGFVRQDLEVEFEHRRGGLEAQYVYRSELFRPETVERLAQRFGELLSNLVDAPDRTAPGTIGVCNP